MGNYSIVEYGNLSESQKQEAVEVFIEGFGHLMTFTKDHAILKSLFSTSLNATYILTYVEDDIVLGVLGIATNCVRPIKFSEEDCIKHFGKFKGFILCRQMNAIFQSQVVTGDTDLYIDILATAKTARNKGIASKLIQYSFDLPNYQNYYIEVFSKNINAKRLYEKLGFVTYKKSRFSILSLRGSGYPIKMKKV